MSRRAGYRSRTRRRSEVGGNGEVRRAGVLLVAHAVDGHRQRNKLRRLCCTRESKREIHLPYLTNDHCMP